MSEHSYRRNSRRLLAATLVLATALAVFGWFLAWSLNNPEGLHRWSLEHRGRGDPLVSFAYGLLVVPALLGMTLWSLWRLLDRRPVLVLSEDGLFFRGWGVGVIPWPDVQGVRLEIEEGERQLGWTPRRFLLCFDIREGERYLVRKHGGGEFRPSDVQSFFRIRGEQVDGRLDEIKARLEPYLLQSDAPKP